MDFPVRCHSLPKSIFGWIDVRRRSGNRSGADRNQLVSGSGARREGETELGYRSRDTRSRDTDISPLTLHPLLMYTFIIDQSSKGVRNQIDLRDIWLII